MTKREGSTKKSKSQLALFLAFFRVGIFGYGGGPSSIPLVHKEVVEHYSWFTDDEFGDLLALGNTLPGPIATKLAGYIGYRVAGPLGMFNAVLATILPTIVAMIVLLTTLSMYKDKEWVQGMTKAVVPVVGFMLAQLTWQFTKKSKADMGWMKALVIILLSLVLMEFIRIHPGIIIGILLLYAWFGTRDSSENEDEKASGAS
ncbi:chromate transporter [Pseudalkalibacillus salsuginis]|uniref:chromate transporter n=1 Tax=Pseudalkalibacillus salsuginis TaxID=2910972 RepID=UPI001F333F0B|nr:chromate transporter [Pseudalkalibacillus salsuginis]MCF6410934.1 chromate transporter [Pseudalkalibacillus salsuginis]